MHHGSGGDGLDADSKFTKQDRMRSKKNRVHFLWKRWHGLLTVQLSGRLLEVLKQSASNFFSDGVIPGRCSLLAKNFCFLQIFII